MKKLKFQKKFSNPFKKKFLSDELTRRISNIENDKNIEELKSIEELFKWGKERKN